MTKNRAGEVNSGRKSIGRQRKGASFPAPAGKGELPADYTVLLGQIKERICSERLRVVSAANEAMVLLYWDIGKAILGRQEQEGWGAKTIDRLSHDLREAVPGLSAGFLLRWSAQPQVHAYFRLRLARPRNCAAGCCPNSVVPQLRPSRQGVRSSDPPMVRQKGPRRGLEPKRSNDTDRDQATRARGQGRH